METKTLYNLYVASGQLKAQANHGKQAKAKEAELGHPVCRISDEAIAQYERTAAEIDALLARFPGVVENYIEETNRAISECLGIEYKTDIELAS